METSRPHDGSPDATQDAPPADALLWGALPHLQLNIAQTAALCGISVRQIGYWTKQEYVVATGRGARRMYGLDALRRIFAIKSAMNSGLSLRQALRSLPAATGGSLPALPAGAYGEPGRRSEDPQPAARLSPQEAEMLSTDLLALFDADRHLRDSAQGLAVKVGRNVDGIRSVAEDLCARGVLSKTDAHGEAVFQRAGKDAL